MSFLTFSVGPYGGRVFNQHRTVAEFEQHLFKLVRAGRRITKVVLFGRQLTEAEIRGLRAGVLAELAWTERQEGPPSPEPDFPRQMAVNAKEPAFVPSIGHVLRRLGFGGSGVR